MILLCCAFGYLLCGVAVAVLLHVFSDGAWEGVVFCTLHILLWPLVVFLAGMIFALMISEEIVERIVGRERLL